LNVDDGLSLVFSILIDFIDGLTQYTGLCRDWDDSILRIKSIIDLIMSIASCPVGPVGFDNHSLMVLKALWHWAFEALLTDGGDDLTLFNWPFILINVRNRLSSLAIFFDRLNIEFFLGSLLLIL